MEIDDVKNPNLFREQFTYSDVPRILFDGLMEIPDLPKDIWITDTTFRDGQQSMAPYTPNQIAHLYSLLHKLDGDQGIIRQSEFFLYSDRDKEAVSKCQAMGYKYPEITGWIRANKDDFSIVKDFNLKETGILTSVSDYHIFLKLKSKRSKVMEQYLDIVRTSLENGIIPRCHFEDITRADMYGFCLPFAEELLKLSQESSLPVKIRLCDTMGYGIHFPGAVLPRSVPKLARAFRKELDYPSDWLEWHGHNDFHKVHANGATAWMYGVSALNSSLLGYGERTGNPPLEGAVMEYIGLKGENPGLNTVVINEIAEYFRNEIHASVPSNYPFVGENFNTTRAGIHADGILKNEEIYNIFDTDSILGRPLKVLVTDKSGMAGIARWINENVKLILSGQREEVTKRHPGIKPIYNWVMYQYEHGRTTSISSEELIAQTKHFIPSLFESDFDQVLVKAGQVAKRIASHVRDAPELHQMESEPREKFLQKLVKTEGAIQLLALTGPDGYRISQVYAQHGEKARFRNLLSKNFFKHEWFEKVMSSGEPYYSDLFFSKYTKRLILTAALPIKDESGDIRAVLDIDFRFDELVKMITNLPEEIIETH